MYSWQFLRSQLAVSKCEVEDSLLISSIIDDSRSAEVGAVFISMPGSNGVRRQHVQDALQKGALLVVSNEPCPSEDLKKKWCMVPDVVTARLQLAQAFYSNPFAEIQCHGVTGTNGKTTTTFIQEALLRAAGKPCALLGTVVMRIGEKQVSSKLTTPGLIDLHAFARQALDAGCKHLVMEVSSHALDQDRVAGISFVRSLFSNLTQDHLDYHREMELYFCAKRRLFMDYLGEQAIVNIDNVYGSRLYEELRNQGIPTWSVSRTKTSGADLCALNLQCDAGGIQFRLGADGPQIKSGLRGEFNADNLLLALGWGKSIGIDNDAMQRGVLQVQVPGRFEIAYDDGLCRVVVDYAHTPDALERVLRTARSLCTGRLVVVFGCGGDRDRGKRPLMGSIAENFADYCIVTSDNPRTESPRNILHEIKQGMRKNNHLLVEDRRTAIGEACAMLGPGDWVVVAGKGHEDYQIVGSTKLHFDDREEVREAMAK